MASAGDAMPISKLLPAVAPMLNMEASLLPLGWYSCPFLGRTVQRDGALGNSR